jgi:hypothetical protein
MNQEVQVAELPERGVAIDGRGEGRPFERDRPDAVRRKQIQKPEQFFGE